MEYEKAISANELQQGGSRKTISGCKKTLLGWKFQHLRSRKTKMTLKKIKSDSEKITDPMSFCLTGSVVHVKGLPGGEFDG